MQEEISKAADEYVAATGIPHSGGHLEAAFEAGAKWALSPRDACPDCKRQKAKSADDDSAGMCPKWWAIRDADAERDCEAHKP